MDLNIHSQYSYHDYFENPQPPRRVLDPIYSFISFDPYIWEFIDTPEFQRLRYIKQLGASYLVFPSGSHTRFEHSLGTAHLANKQMKYLFSNQPSLKTINFASPNHGEEIHKNVLLAGLCHDLGHGPFSHTFDNLIIKKLVPNTSWKHEISSADIFELLCEENHLDIDRENIKMIRNLILGEFRGNHEDKWLFEIVANKTNSIDVDKFDYLLRDGYHLGIKETFLDYKTLMKEARVIDHEICYPSKHAYKLYDLFQTRYKMFKAVYLNRVTQGIDLMISDIFVHANSKYKFSEKINNPKEYLQLTDHILEEIEFSSDQALAKSRDLIKRLKVRDIYRFACEIMLESESEFSMQNEEIVKAEIASLASNEGIPEEISRDDIFLMVVSINFGFQKANPVEHTKFFHKGNLKNSFYLKRNEISSCLPEKFCEYFLRVYVSKKTLIDKVKCAFTKFCKKTFQRKPQGMQTELEDGDFKSEKKRTYKEALENSPFGNIRKKIFK